MGETELFEIISTVKYRKDMKLLTKRYPSIISDMKNLINKLEKEPESGVGLGNSIYKIRFRISSKNKGKSVGGRLITLVKISGKRVYLLTVYDKSEKESLTDKELAGIISNIFE